MAVREIITNPNPTLRQRAKKVRRVTPAVQALIDDMIATMRAANGVGLAAPQVDVSQRVITIEYREETEDPEKENSPAKLYVVVNPEIVRHSSEIVTGNEACLSIPGYFGEVERYQNVTVKGLDRDGKPFRLRAHGWLARIFQHEIDHLEGVLFIDRASEVWRVEEAPDKAPLGA
ncbi:MAG: peptide deformylase [Anaerolineales bacterium]|nr:peptide deformylase [Anaerolineales bacterium]